MNLNAAYLMRLTETEARELLESVRWPNGPVCCYCKSTNAHRMGGKAGAKGQIKCRDCRKKFTIRLGTIFEDSPIPLRDWVYAFARMNASKKGISAHQLHRELNVKYQTAWFMNHRIRHAMADNSFTLSGIVESDEAYIGGKPRKKNNLGPVALKGRQKTKKVPVHTLVERGGKKHTHVMHNRRVTTANLRREINKRVDKSGTLMTDENKSYRTIGREFKGGHKVVNHGTFEYARKADNAHINTAESSHALIKRGIYGTFHHVSYRHLQRYLDEFDFRWNHRDIDDHGRTLAALRQSEGKRLTYHQPCR